MSMCVCDSECFAQSANALQEKIEKEHNGPLTTFDALFSDGSIYRVKNMELGHRLMGDEPHVYHYYLRLPEVSKWPNAKGRLLTFARIGSYSTAIDLRFKMATMHLDEKVIEAERRITEEHECDEEHSRKKVMYNRDATVSKDLPMDWHERVMLRIVKYESATQAAEKALKDASTNLQQMYQLLEEKDIVMPNPDGHHLNYLVSIFCAIVPRNVTHKG